MTFRKRKLTYTFTLIEWREYFFWDLMNVELVGRESIGRAFERLRAAPLEAAGGEEIFLYRDATMRLGDFHPDELNLTSLYVLEQNLAIQRDLHRTLLERYDIDTLRLSEVLRLKTGTEVTGMAPPVVEIYEETVHIVPRAGDRMPPIPLVLKIAIVKDGIHRVTLARELGKMLRCVVISGADRRILPYAYPNHWSQVQIYPTKDEIPLKKFYRREDPYSFMGPLKVLRQVGDTPTASQWNR